MNKYIEANSLDEMNTSSGLAFLLFSTPNCGVCDALKLKLPRWSKAQGYNARFLWLDLSRFPEACSLFQVLSVPTLIVKLDRQELSRQVRHINLHLLQEQVSRSIAIWSQAD
ncbi:thioredoxin family protein [Oceanospirillum maris]|uniref:thioredoxin family protein n=1 Tax=Oceanospirillum maris TaxID=64977 RepID=UPI0004052ECC|nr:thioredoxin family protein [Oceanospirillum maris]